MVLEEIQRAWDRGSIIFSVLVSLSIQCILIILAPFRKRTANGMLIFSLWFGYLLADWTANFAIGLISKSIRQRDVAVYNSDLLAFWAPFLLVHLGGPDTITAFALEDNELWLRHFLGLIVQTAAVGYSFFQTRNGNKLWLPTLLVLISGMIKYIERTCSLYFGNLESFRESVSKDPDPGPDYAKLMEEYFSKSDARHPTRVEMIPARRQVSVVANSAVPDSDRLPEIEIIHNAHKFFQIFKYLIVDRIFTFQERNESRKFFMQRTAEDAYRVIEVELNFIYDVFFTKVVVVHGTAGYISRFVSVALVLAAFLLFFVERKQGFHPVDVGVTYVLLGGAMGIEMIAFLMLVLSDWVIVSIEDDTESWRAHCFIYLLGHKIEMSKIGIFKFWSRRWSGYFNTYNLLDVCVEKRLKTTATRTKFLRFLDLVGGFFKKLFRRVSSSVKNLYHRLVFVKEEKCTPDLWEFIFKEVQSKAKLAEYPSAANEIGSARGEWVLKDDYKNLLPWVNEFEYDASLLVWHIATELCYNKVGLSATNDLAGAGGDNTRKFSKLLSDYMLYLVVMQPTLMSTVMDIGQTRFEDTCAEAEKFFSRKGLRPKEVKTRASLKTLKEMFLCRKGRKPTEIKRRACKEILEVNTELRPVEVKGDKSKSVLFDGCRLAKKLMDLEDGKWEIISKVWVELLCYAASHCRPSTYAQQVSKGGELIGFVWLLTAHFGLGEQFRFKEGQARAKLVVVK